MPPSDCEWSLMAGPTSALSPEEMFWNRSLLGAVVYLLEAEENSIIRWTCGYGYYQAEAEDYTYVVSKQWQRGEHMWLAYVHDNETGNSTMIADPLPLNRRQAKALCERHHELVQSHG